MGSALLHGNAALALAAALMWGGGDFSGGMGVRTVGGGVGGALRIVLLSHFASFSVLMVLAGVTGAPFPHGRVLAAGLVAGVTGGLSLTAFYMALARGAMGTSAAISGLLAAAIPALVSALSEGSPGTVRLLGFAVAGPAIWLIAASPPGRGANKATGLAVLSGAGFGVYFVALKLAGPGGLIWAMGTARMGSLTICTVLLLLVSNGGMKVRVPMTAMPWILLAALLDTSGNLLFVAATRAGRLDVAAVLASLYPATTILLAAWTLKERPTQRQGWGMVVAAIAVVLITQ